MGNVSSVDSSENISKADTRLSKKLKSQPYKEFKENTLSNYQIKLKDIARRLLKNITKFFNPTAAVTEHQEKHLRR